MVSKYQEYQSYRFSNISLCVLEAWLLRVTELLASSTIMFNITFKRMKQVFVCQILVPMPMLEFSYTFFCYFNT